MLVRYGQPDQSIDVFIDAIATPLQGMTGLAYDTSGLVCYYRIGATGSATQLTLASQTVTGTHTDGGFVELDATYMPGLYRLDLPDAIALADVYSMIYLSGAAGMYPCKVRVEPDWARALLDADVTTDTSSVPWNKVSSAVGQGTEVLRKRVYDVNGNNITDTDTVVGRLTQ